MRKLILLAAMIVSACGSATLPSDGNETSAASATTEATNSESPKPRLLTTAELARAVGSDCRTPTGSMRKGGTTEEEFYVLTCRNTSLLVSVNMDGSSKFIDCKVAAGLGTPCNKNWD